MADAGLFVFDDGVEVDVLDAAENIGFHEGIGFFEFGDEFLGLKALG